MKEIGLYIHIPFCKSKCYYCDFASFSANEKWIDKYIQMLIEELRLYKDLVKDTSIKSIFIGGGTPSHIEARYIGEIMNFIKNNFNTKNLQEISIEVNPGSIDIDKARVYRDSGINRISMGVQTLNDIHLKSIGRIHNEEEVYESLEILKKAGFTNINLDFIFGLPGEKLGDVERNLSKIKDLGVNHISYYGLIIEEGTPLYELDKRGRLDIPTEFEEREMYYLIKDRLKSMGYLHYEISNFSLEGKECKHNILYWKIDEYIGLGLASHSYLKGKRYWNRDNFSEYFADIEGGRLPVEGGEEITREMEISEFAIMGLRLIGGIDKELFKKRFENDIEYFFKASIEKHLVDGLISVDENSIKLTSKGLDLANIVEVDFLL